MKLLELSTDKVLDVLCELTPHITEIVKDKQLLEVWQDKMVAKKSDNAKDIRVKGLAYGFDKIEKLVPMVLKGHRESLYNILAIMNEKDLDQVKNQSAIITIKETKELLMDKELIGFFTELMQ